MKGSNEPRLTGGLPATKAADEGLIYHNPSPTGTGLTSSLKMIGKTPEGNGETIASLLFSCDFRRPQLAQRRGRHDDVASNDERKETSSRTGEWRTNKKRHILGALGISFDIILFFFKVTGKTWASCLFYFPSDPVPLKTLSWTSGWRSWRFWSLKGRAPVSDFPSLLIICLGTFGTRGHAVAFLLSIHFLLDGYRQEREREGGILDTMTLFGFNCLSVRPGSDSRLARLAFASARNPSRPRECAMGPALDVRGGGAW